MDMAEKVRSDPGLTDFTKKVLMGVLEVEPGETVTYGELARRLGMGKSGARAVARALSENPYPVDVPCHRVVRRDGLGGYRWGVERKAELLRSERGTPCA